MNSTNADLDHTLLSFFQSELSETARSLREQGAQLLVPGPDSESTTYYIRRSKTRMEPADFELKLTDLAEVRQRLRGLWKGAEETTLGNLTDKILALAPHFDSIEDTEEVSPFVYVMF
ncbi:MAG: hypothetical protein FJY85_14550 [Deltaproteobacteria bacterium]|nr:hypothetical protein [Deltaproteobacteria bacterium]